MSGPCFCHPQEPAKFHQFPPPKPEKPARVFSQPKTGNEALEKEDNTIKHTNPAGSQAPNSSETCDSTEAEPPSRTSPCLE